MRLRVWFALGGVACALASGFEVTPASAGNTPGSSNTVVRFQIERGTSTSSGPGTNSLGSLDVELFDQDKPETVRNFLLYVRSGAYSNSFLHRCVPGFVVQG